MRFFFWGFSSFIFHTFHTCSTYYEAMVRKLIGGLFMSLHPIDFVYISSSFYMGVIGDSGVR